MPNAVRTSTMNASKLAATNEPRPPASAAILDRPGRRKAPLRHSLANYPAAASSRRKNRSVVGRTRNCAPTSASVSPFPNSHLSISNWFERPLAAHTVPRDDSSLGLAHSNCSAWPALLCRTGGSAIGPARDFTTRIGTVCGRRRLPRYSFRNSSGSFAKLAAIRRASSRVSSFADDRRPGPVEPARQKPTGEFLPLAAVCR